MYEFYILISLALYSLKLYPSFLVSLGLELELLLS